MGCERAASPKVVLGHDDTLQIVFTSGTTAEPKGVVITHGNVLANIAPIEREMRRYRKYERLVHPLRFLNLLPLSHVFGQFLGLFLPPLLGATVIFQQELKPSEVMNTIRRERVSVLVTVPRVLQSLKQKIEHDVEDHGETESFRRRFQAAEKRHFLRRWWMFRAIRRQFGWKFWAFISGGAALDSETEEFWGSARLRGDPGIRADRNDFADQREPSVPAGEGIDRQGAAGTRSETRGGRRDSGARRRRVFGILGGRRRRQLSDPQGWYRTGDIGALDAAGNLYFKGRKKEVIVTPGGTNVYPDDLEAALRRQPEVKDCVVVGMERDGNAEPCAVVILRGNPKVEKVRVADVVQRANESLAEYQRMRMWVEWPEEDFPRTSTQKPRRNLIRETAQAQMQALIEKHADSGASSPLADLIAHVTRRPVGALREGASLDSDLGLSSLDRVELLSTLEDRYQIDLSEARLARCAPSVRWSACCAEKRRPQRRITILPGRYVGR